MRPRLIFLYLLTMAAMMSGSGPTVFAIVEDSQKAKDIVSKIQLDFDADVFAVETAEKNF